MNAKQKYVVLQPFDVMDTAGNPMTIHSNEVIAKRADKVWMSGKVGHISFRALATIFLAATALKN